MYGTRVDEHGQAARIFFAALAVAAGILASPLGDVSWPVILVAAVSSFLLYIRLAGRHRPWITKFVQAVTGADGEARDDSIDHTSSVEQRTAPSSPDDANRPATTAVAPPSERLTAGWRRVMTPVKGVAWAILSWAFYAVVGLTMGIGLSTLIDGQGPPYAIPSDDDNTVLNAPRSVNTGLGSVWVLDARTLTRLNPATGKAIRQFLLGDESVNGMAVAGNKVWLLTEEREGPNYYLVRIDPITEYKVVIPLRRYAKAPLAIAGSKSDVWLVDSDPPANLVRRFDAATGAETAVISIVGAEKLHGSIVLGGSDVWVAAGDGVVRVDASRNRVAAYVQLSGGPFSLGAGPDGSIWVTSSTDGSLARIDPRTNRVVARLRLAHRPVAVTVTRTDAWTVSEDGFASRVALRNNLTSAQLKVGEQNTYTEQGNYIANLGKAIYIVTDSLDSLSRIDTATNRVWRKFGYALIPSGRIP
jgi:hypothetical protein